MRFRDLLTMVTALVLIGTNAFSQEKLDTPKFPGSLNFRDVAGTVAADTTATGQQLRPGVFYRSAALSKLTDTDAAVLAKLGLTLVIDLRTPCEIHGGCSSSAPGAPDRPLVVGGQPVPDININIFGFRKLQPVALESADAADQMMMAYYIGFVFNAGDRAAFHTALHDLATAKGPVLFHCSAGKDRSGWLAVLLQTIVGVPMPQIEQDYLASNQYQARSIAAFVASQPAPERPAWEEIVTVQPQFLNAAYAAVQLRYGNMDTYIRKGIGLSSEDISSIRAKLAA